MKAMDNNSDSFTVQVKHGQSSNPNHRTDRQRLPRATGRVPEGVMRGDSKSDYAISVAKAVIEELMAIAKPDVIQRGGASPSPRSIKLLS